MKKQSVGFTLIELMLVIVVVGLLSVYIVRMINQTILTSQAEKTVSEMVNLKSAVLAYFAENKTWPKDLSADLIPAFLPSNALCSPYVSSSLTADCHGNALYSGEFVPATGNAVLGNGASQLFKWGYYEISITVPSQSSANQLISRLPSSWVDTDGKTVHMSISTPGLIGNLPNHGWIVSAGAVSFTPNYENYEVNYPTTLAGKPQTSPPLELGPQIYLPNCPSGYEGHIFLTPFHYQSYGYYMAPGVTPTAQMLASEDMHIAMVETTTTPGSGVKSDSPNITTNTQNSIVSYFNYNGTQNPYPCNIDHGNLNNGDCGIQLTSGNTLPIRVVEPNDANGNPTALIVGGNDNINTGDMGTSHLAYFVTYCVASGHWATNYIDPMWAQDGQCTFSWDNQYNSTARNNCNIVGNNTYYQTVNPGQYKNNIPYLVANPGWNNSGQDNGNTNQGLSVLLQPVGNSRAY